MTPAIIHGSDGISLSAPLRYTMLYHSTRRGCPERWWFQQFRSPAVRLAIILPDRPDP